MQIKIVKIIINGYIFKILKYIYIEMSQESLEKILPQNIISSLKKYDYRYLQEIRLRYNQPLIIIYDNKKLMLKDIFNSEIICSDKLLNYILMKTTNYSIYKVENQIKKGFLMYENGIRIGIGGEYVKDNQNLSNIYSLNIRIPHQVKDCSLKIINNLIKNEDFFNTLIISPPGAGKTTMLRDIIYQLNNKNLKLNVTIIDDRNEITNFSNGKSFFDLGKYTDIIANLNKKIAIENAIKSLSPDIIVTDEITTLEDIEAINFASNMGVKIMSTIHCDKIENLINKKELKYLLEYKIFDRYVILSKKYKIGEIDSVLDRDFQKIW